MIILIIHDIRIAVLKLEGHSPVAADPDSVPPFILSLQGVQAPPRQIHIRNICSGVQGGQLVTQLVLMVGIDAPGIVATAVCRMFNDATSEAGWPERISSDNDPLFQYNRWKANLRVLEIDEIKSLPHVPMSHPFVERLIGNIRRELLDQTLFWTAPDLENKLREYQCYYSEHRCHAGLDGATPVDSGRENIVTLNDYRWKKHCRGLFQLPVAA